MEVKIIEDAKNKLVMELPGEGHAICNQIKSALWTNKNVKAAGYNISHPLVGVPKIVIETKTGKPKDALLQALKDVKSDSDKFLKAFNKVAK